MIYNFFVSLLFLIFLPKFLFQILFQKKYRKSLLYRLGKMPEKVDENRFVIWIHAVSVGEIKAAAQLFPHLKKKYPDAFFVLSCITETGKKAAESIPVDKTIYLPLDFSWVMKRLVEKIHPNLFILIETDFWPQLLYFIKKQGAKIYLVSGKISERSSQWYQFFPSLFFSSIDLFCVQNELYQNRFISLGILKEKVKVTGNLKKDERPFSLGKKEKEKWKERFGIKNQPVVSISCTHDPEEKLLLEEMRKVWKEIPSLTVFLAPRHPERFSKVKKILSSFPISFISYSDLSRKDFIELSRADSKEEKKGRVILIDTMGFLPTCYQLSDLAILGGSFTDQIGGHNPLEPIFSQIPVFMGMNMKTQIELAQEVLEKGAGEQMKGEEIASFLLKFYKDPSYRSSLEEGVRAFISREKGVGEKTLKAIVE